MSSLNLTQANAELGHDAPALVQWALGLGKSAIVTTNFRPFEAVILHMVAQVQPGLTPTGGGQLLVVGDVLNFFPS